MCLCRERDKGVQALLARLNGKVELCDLIRGPECNADLLFNEQLTMLELVYGLLDPNIQHQKKKQMGWESQCKRDGAGAKVQCLAPELPPPRSRLIFNFNFYFYVFFSYKLKSQKNFFEILISTLVKTHF